MTWILPKQLISAYALDTEELTSDYAEQSQICERLLMRRSKRSPARTYLREWKAGNLTRLRSGLILKPSRGERFLTEWTSSLVATPANHSLPPGNASEQTIPATSGHSSQTVFGFFDLASVSLKMSKDTSVSDSERSLENWNQWVTKCRGEYSLRVKSAPLTKENESSSLQWPTARAMSGVSRKLGTGGRCLQEEAQRYGHPAPVNPSTHLSHPESWLTPRANEPTQDINFVTRNADRGEHCHSSLTTQAKAWETPTVSTGGHRQADGSMTPKLDQQVKTWATPSANDTNRSPEAYAKAKEKHGSALQTSLQIQAIQSNKSNGKLNSQWVCLLMDLPMGWVTPSCPASVIQNWQKFMSGWNDVTIAPTSCACSETELCQQPQP